MPAEDSTKPPVTTKKGKTLINYRYGGGRILGSSDLANGQYAWWSSSSGYTFCMFHLHQPQSWGKSRNALITRTSEGLSFFRCTECNFNSRYAYLRLQYLRGSSWEKCVQLQFPTWCIGRLKKRWDSHGLPNISQNHDLIRNLCDFCVCLTCWGFDLRFPDSGLIVAISHLFPTRCGAIGSGSLG